MGVPHYMDREWAELELQVAMKETEPVEDRPLREERTPGMLQYSISMIVEDKANEFCVFPSFEEAQSVFSETESAEMGLHFTKITNVLYRGDSGTYYLIQEVCPDSGC